MTLLVFGLDGLDSTYVQERGLLGSLDAHRLDQGLEGANRLYTYRVWPSIFASDDGGASDDEWAPYIPENPYIWDEIASAVLMAPIPVDNGDRVEKSQWNGGYQDEFPSELWKESWAPPDRLDDGLEHLEAGIGRQLGDATPLVVATTRIPDMLMHHWGDDRKTHMYIERACDLCERMCARADDYLVVSDHGIVPDGPGGLDDHTENATFASSFTDYETMSGLIDGFKNDIHAQVNKHQMDALGYR